MSREANLIAVVVLLLISPLRADEIVLKDGTSGQAKVIESTKDSLKLEVFPKSGGSAILTLSVDRVDPHSFYDLRSRNMESTAENHIELARFCIQEEMFSRAQSQIEQARELDPDYVKSVATPEVKEGIAGKLVNFARQQLEKGNAKEAEKWVSVVLTRAPESKAAESAGQLLAEIETAAAGKAAAKAKAKEERIRASADLKAQAAHDERISRIKPVQKVIDEADAQISRAMREKNGGNAKKMLEAAAKALDECLKEIDKLDAGVEQGDEETQATLAELRAESMDRAVKANINAGRVAIGQGSFDEATDYGRMALAVDADSAAAQEFLEEVAAAAALATSTSRRF